MLLEAILAYAAQHAAGNEDYMAKSDNDHQKWFLRCKKCSKYTHGCHGYDGPCGAFEPTS